MGQDAIRLLIEDHEKVRDLLGRLTRTDNESTAVRTDLLDQIANELRVHTKLEEKVFYPAFRQAGGQEENRMYHEAIEEHRAVEELVLPDLEKTDPASDQFAGRAKVLKELVEHHAEEEESELFPKARDLFDQEKLSQLGQEMAELKQRFTP